MLIHMGMLVKTWHMYTVELCSAVEKNDRKFTGKSMELESIQLCEVVQKDKIPICCIISDPSLARSYGCCERGRQEV